MPGFDISGISLYCDETGGDYYDFLKIREDAPGRAGIVVGDVSGHGIQSALLMASARASLRQRVSLPGSLSEIVADVNRQFCLDVRESGAFMTLFYLAVDSTRRSLRWVRAGHDPAIFFDPVTGTFEELSGKGSPLGFDEDVVFEEKEKRGAAKGSDRFCRHGRHLGNDRRAGPDVRQTTGARHHPVPPRPERPADCANRHRRVAGVSAGAQGPRTTSPWWW